jgi:nucleoside-diphosphate-sugar epimerase
VHPYRKEGNVNIFVAGASGAIGQPLVAELIRQGHTVTGMTHSDAGADKLKQAGAGVARVSAFDALALEEALRRSSAEIVIDQLTALPKDPSQMAEAAPGDRKLRLEGGGNLLRAAQATGVRRYIQQSSGFFLKAGNGLADETESLATDATPRVAASAQTYTELESRLFSAPKIEGVSLRYGFFYGPNTWFHRDGASADQVRKQQTPVIGKGQGVWSWIHIDDSALATVAAITAPAGIYNIVDDDPSPVSVWLPAFARSLRAPAPPQITEEQGRQLAGEDVVYYHTKLRGASNKKAREILKFQPRRLEWLNA